MDSKKILLVDDNESVRRSVSYFLTSNNYQVQTAEDGEEALKKLKDTPPDMIILDMKMPKMNGMTFIKRLQQVDKFKDIPIILITAVTNFYGDIEVGDTAIKVLQKPFSLDQLLKNIKITLDQK